MNFIVLENTLCSTVISGFRDRFHKLNGFVGLEVRTQNDLNRNI